VHVDDDVDLIPVGERLVAEHVGVLPALDDDRAFYICVVIDGRRTRDDLRSLLLVPHIREIHLLAGDLDDGLDDDGLIDGRRVTMGATAGERDKTDE